MRHLVPALAFLAVQVAAVASLAQADVDVTMTASQVQLGVDDTFTLQISAKVSDGDLEDLTIPDLGDFDVLAQQTSKPVQFSFGFGTGSGSRIHSSSTTIHTLRLQPIREGTFRLQPAVATVDGKLYRSPPLVIRVQQSSSGAATTNSPATANADDDAQDDTLSGAKYDDKAFVRVIVDNDNPYVGQQVNVTIRLYTRLNIAQGRIVPSKPDMEGFWVQDLNRQQAARGTANVRGRTYRTFDMYRFAAFPLRTGTLRVGAARVKFEVAGFGFFSSGETLERTGVPLDIEVKPLPEPRAPNTVVGRFSLETKVQPERVTTGNASTIRVIARGTGRIESLELAMPEIEGLRVLQPSIKDRASAGQARQMIGGTRTWEWIAIPQAPGRYTIPSLQIRFFDPNTETYGAAHTQAKVITAEGAAPGTQTTDVGTVPPPVPDSEAQFGPIRRESSLTRRTPPLRSQTWFKAALLAPPLGFALLWLGLGWRRRRLGRDGGVEAQVERSLKQASNALTSNRPREFYDQVVEALRAALDARLARSTAGMTQNELQQALHQQGFDSDLVERIRSELEGADFARFAAAGVDKTEMDRCLQRAKALLHRITAAAVFVMALAAAPLSAQTIQATFASANDAANHGKTVEALRAYDTLLQAGVDDADLHYNLGTVWAESGAYPRAIFHFEKAITLRPGDDEARRDLARAEKQLENQRAEREGEATIRKSQSIGDALFGWVTGDQLSWVLLLSNATLFLALGWIVLRSRRRWAVAIASLAAAGLVFGAAGAAVKAGVFQEGNAAVVVEESASLYEGPDKSTRVRGVARGGDRCQIVRREGDFVQIRLAGGGGSGWTETGKVGDLGPEGLSR